ncbi:hypothetical protein, partial [Escherichia coli]|uniref:hypothetical protein n=1 Tax=Escherichia coli TaxID=562 RepID=UPI001BDC2A02
LSKFRFSPILSAESPIVCDDGDNVPPIIFCNHNPPLQEKFLVNEFAAIHHLHPFERFLIVSPGNIP